MLLLLLSLASASVWDLNQKETLYFHDYKLSFKAPYFYPNNSNTIPYFKSNVVASQHSVRLTSSIPSTSGSIWSNNKCSYKNWLVEFSFTSWGRNYFGGNGVAFWFTTGKEKSGPVFGNDDAFDGLLVAFDTADVANERYSPIITASLNDGKKSQKKVGSCFRDFRNTPGPVWARISYRNKKLVVSVDLLSEGKAFSDCFSIDEISLPDSGYFGISSSTADDYYDDHDVFSLETYQLDAPPKEKVKRPTEDKHIKNKDEFKLDDKTKEKIKKITEEYKSSVPKPNQGGFQEAINIHTIQKLQENQFKIIEALNLVHHLPLVQHSNSEPKVGELDQIKSMLSNLTSSVLELSEIVKLAFSRSSNTDPNVVRYVDQHMDKLHEKLDGTKKVIDESKGSMFMYLLWFLVGCVVMWVIRLVRKGTEKSKKFI